jgi:hypothetical protein
MEAARGDDGWELSAGEARGAHDPVLARFAADVAENCRIYDLRALRPGMGFDWSPLMPDGQVRRDGRNMIFAIEPRSKSASLLGRLVKRRA